MEIIKAQLEAKQNIEKLETFMPSELKRQENQLATTFAKHQGNLFSKLKDLYAFMDGIYSFVARFTPCRKGCSFCCHIPVTVSKLEIEYIKKNVRTFRRKVVHAAAAAANNSPCPFLSKGACSIYEVRPFVCRRHVVLTATSYWCHFDRCNTIKLSMLKFSEIDKVYEQILFESGLLANITDIRTIRTDY